MGSLHDRQDVSLRLVDGPPSLKIYFSPRTPTTERFMQLYKSANESNVYAALEEIGRKMDHADEYHHAFVQALLPLFARAHPGEAVPIDFD